MIFASFLPGQSGLVQHSSTIVPFHAVGAPHEGHIESLLHTTVYSSEAAGLMVERIFGITPPERVTRISAPLANCFVLMKAALYPGRVLLHNLRYPLFQYLRQVSMPQPC